MTAGLAINVAVDDRHGLLVFAERRSVEKAVAQGHTIVIFEHELIEIGRASCRERV